MRSLPLIAILLISWSSLFAQSPHGTSFNMECVECHTTASWQIDNSKMTFSHSSTGFELAGQHKSVVCRQCHSTLVFNQAKQECSSCHNDVHKSSVSPDCAKCHTPKTWLVTDVNQLHQVSRFPLVGRHKTADCVQCHTRSNELNFEVAGISCFDCHSADYNSAQNPNHITSAFSKDCESCHNMSSSGWSFASFAHTTFPLQGGHARQNCYDCHTPNTFSGLSKECYACHNDDFTAAVNPNHTQNNFSTVCSSCHNINAWKPATFDHATTGFQLTGRHINTSCISCHTAGYSNTSAECKSCHLTNYNNAADPNHIQNNFSLVCASCHNTNAWKPATFDHSTTGFQLTGKHITATCISCHASGYNNTSSECSSCHINDFNTAASPNHIAAAFPQQCQQCHTTSNWDVANFDHTTYTQFPLAGKHINVNCSECHQSGYANTPQECNACHNNDFTGATNPNHVSANFPTACETCHNVNGWTPAQFDHDQRYFPIYSGKHRGEWTLCSDCHTNSNNYAVFSCITCHEHNRSDMDNEHRGVSGYVYASAECLSCHPDGDGDGAFNHLTSQFPLTGAHINLECSLCHTQGYATPPQTDCVACHATDRNSTHNPDHSAANFSNNCTECHSSTAWTPSSYLHTSAYQLTGAHTSAACSDCHTSGYSNIPHQCNDCHSGDVAQVLDPPHSALNFSLTCSECHTTTAWLPSSYDHDGPYFPVYSGEHRNKWNECSDCHTNPANYSSNSCINCHEHNESEMNTAHLTVNGYSFLNSACFACHPVGSVVNAFNHSTSPFPLTGAHINVQCGSCHTNGYPNTPSDCNSCHNQDYSGAVNPNHSSAGLAVTCENCHNSYAWIPSTFDHGTSGFRLTGGHNLQQCSDCHSGTTSGTSNVCSSCHQDDFNSAANPNHITLGLANTCSDCHTNNPGWAPATFPVHNNYFQLQGAHLSIRNNCSQCHNGNYSTTPNTCYACHTADFNGVTSPNHVSQQYPHECEDCHTQSAWTPSTFNHDTQYFPVYSGEHRNEWSTCSQCHTNPANYAVFSCITCHEHNQTSMNSEHQGVSGYVYQSAACFDCHPDGDSKKMLKSREME